jgi:hypothetical protein
MIDSAAPKIILKENTRYEAKAHPPLTTVFCRVNRCSWYRGDAKAFLHADKMGFVYVVLASVMMLCCLCMRSSARDEAADLRKGCSLSGMLTTVVNLNNRQSDRCLV